MPFDSASSERELAVLLAPASAALHLRVVDTAEQLVVRPSGIMMWWLVFWITVPLLVFAGHLWSKGSHGENLEGLDYVGIVIACLQAPLALGCAWWVTRHEVEKGDFFHLDKLSGILVLSRLGHELERRQIDGFLEVHAWHKTEDSHTWIGELSVLTRGEDGRTFRYPVVTSLHVGAISRVAMRISEHFRK